MLAGYHVTMLCGDTSASLVARTIYRFVGRTIAEVLEYSAMNTTTTSSRNNRVPDTMAFLFSGQVGERWILRLCGMERAINTQVRRMSTQCTEHNVLNGSNVGGILVGIGILHVMRGIQHYIRSHQRNHSFRILRKRYDIDQAKDFVRSASSMFMACLRISLLPFSFSPPFTSQRRLKKC